MSSLRVNTIVNTNNNGAVEFTRGASVPQSQVIIAPNITLTGIITANSFIGDGSRIINFVPNEVTNSKAVAFSLIT